MELKPENQVTCSDVRSGAFKKWTMEYSAEVTKIDQESKDFSGKLPDFDVKF